MNVIVKVDGQEIWKWTVQKYKSGQYVKRVTIVTLSQHNIVAKLIEEIRICLFDLFQKFVQF